MATHKYYALQLAMSMADKQFAFLDASPPAGKSLAKKVKPAGKLYAIKTAKMAKSAAKRAKSK